MFSCNGKISEKQLQKMLVSSVFAGTIFVLPYLSARLFGKSIVLGVLSFLVFGGLYMFYFYGIGEHYEIGKNKLFLLLRVVRLTIRLAFYLVLAVAVLGEAEVPFMQGKEADKLSNLLVILPLLFVAVYGANTARVGMKKQSENIEQKNIKTQQDECLDIEKQGRVREMIFWPLFVPFVVMVLFGLKEVDYEVFIPHLDMPVWLLLFFGYVFLTFLLPVENYLYVRPSLRGKNANGRNAFLSAFAVLVMLAFLTLFLVGIYGLRGAAQEEMLTIAIMRYIRLPFGVLERFDVLMVWFFMAGCFVLICETLYYAGYLLSQIFERVKRIWLLLVLLLAALLLVWFLPDCKETIFLFLCYGAIFDIPFSIILPIIEMVIIEKNRRRG